MSPMSKVMAFFPASVGLLFLAAVTHALKNPSFLNVLLVPATLYLYPLLSYRIHDFFFPIREGKYNLSLSEYNAWWGGHQIQLIYYACPFLEAILRTVPGAFSLWLRAWGSSIGKDVYWTPNAEIDDRSLVKIGDGVVFGHKIEMISHVIAPKDGKLSLLSKAVVVGDKCFLGAGSRFGPGATIEAGTALPILSDIYINEVISPDHDLKYVHPRFGARDLKEKESSLRKSSPEVTC
jgi:hypothetical protein